MKKFLIHGIMACLVALAVSCRRNEELPDGTTPTPPGTETFTECEGGIFKMSIDGTPVTGREIRYFYQPTDGSTLIMIFGNDVLPLLTFDLTAAPYGNNTFTLNQVLAPPYTAGSNYLWLSNVFLNGAWYGLQPIAGGGGTFTTTLAGDRWKIEFDGNVKAVNQQHTDSMTVHLKAETVVVNAYNVNAHSPIAYQNDFIQSESTLEKMLRFEVSDPDGDPFVSHDYYGAYPMGKVICSNFDYWEMDIFQSQLPLPGVWAEFTLGAGFKDDAAVEDFNITHQSNPNDIYFDLTYRAYFYLKLGSPQFYEDNFAGKDRYIKFMIRDRAGNSSLPITARFY